jgi:uncharacterized YccA/Bax inhibitor family protein
MIATILTLIGTILSCVIGLWKYFGRKASETRANVTSAQSMVQEGLNENDISKITAGFARLRSV